MSKLVFRLLNHKDITGRLAYADDLLQEYKRVVNEIEGICMGVVHSEEDDKEAMRKNLAWLDEKRVKYGDFAEYEAEENKEKIGFRYAETGEAGEAGEAEKPKKEAPKEVPKEATESSIVQKKVKKDSVVPKKEEDEDDDPIPKEFLSEQAKAEPTEKDVRKALLILLMHLVIKKQWRLYIVSV
ncbi:MAG: hypothetical protein R3Y53_10805 [Bacillota bacterium]